MGSKTPANAPPTSLCRYFLSLYPKDTPRADSDRVCTTVGAQVVRVIAAGGCGAATSGEMRKLLEQLV